jgi:mammalian cell entry related domain protein
MRNEPNKKMIGLFMATGIIVLLIIFGIFIKSNFFTKDDKMLVMYFEESINGLSVGSPVVFKGVQVGKVARIEINANPEELTFSIPVYAKMDARQSIHYSGSEKIKYNLLSALVEKGLRARLTTQSYLTGQLMIELEMFPDTPVVMRGPENQKNMMEIPTILSPLGEISKGIQDLPIRESVVKFNQFFTSLNEELPEIRKIVKNMGKAVDGNAGAAADTLDNLNKAAINVSQAAKALRNFADYIERHPEALLKGKRDK